MDPIVDSRLPLSSLRHFMNWWMGELDVLFSQLKFGRPQWQTLLYKTRTGLDIYIRAHGDIKQIATFSDDADEGQKLQILHNLHGRHLSGRNVVLRLSNELALRRELTLPKAISDVIEPVLENQVEQIAPWPPDQSCFGYVMSDSDGRDDVVSVDLVAVRKKTVEAALARASALGFKHVRLDISDDIEQRSGIELVNHRKSGAGRSAGDSARVLGLLFAISLLVGMVGVSRMLNVQSDVELAEKKLAILNMNNSMVGEARSTNAELIRQRNRLLGIRKSRRSVAVVLDVLARVLPDDTQLTRFEMNNGRIVLSGRADNAADLVDRLEKSDYFFNVRFFSPTVRNSDDTKETFSIEVELQPAREGGGKI